MGMSPNVWLRPGDVVAVSIPPLGTLRSPITDRIPPLATLPVPRARVPSADTSAVRVAGRTLHVEATGPEHGPAVLFFHGLGGSCTFFRPLIDALGLSATHRCVLYDLEGHGRSPLAGASLSIDGFAASGAALLAKLGISSATVVAHSMGGVGRRSRSLGC